jgi:hypothetical protein
MYIMVMRQKSITITEEQAEFVDEDYINLSQFVQSKLDELMEERGEDE